MEVGYQEISEKIEIQAGIKSWLGIHTMTNKQLDSDWP